MSMAPSHAQGELVAQVTPGVTTPVLLFTADELRHEVVLIFASNHGTGNVTYRLFHDNDGTTFDDTTEIIHGQKAQNSGSEVFQARHPGSGIHVKKGGSLGCEISVANDMTITVYAVTETLAERVRPGVR